MKKLLLKLLLGFGKGLAEDKLVELIEKAEAKNPVAVKALEDAIKGLLPLLKQLAEDPETTVDDEAVEFLAELIAKLEENDTVEAQDDTDPDEGHGGDPEDGDGGNP
jgi:hypothetical protein